MRELRFYVAGTPISQGSKKCWCRNGQAVMIEQLKALGPWRTRIRQAARKIEVTWVKGTPLQVDLDFVFPPTKERRSGWKVSSPDIDKLARAVLDGLTQDDAGRGVLPDDSQVVRLTVTKTYGTESGVFIRVVDAPSAYDQLPLVL